MYPIDLHRTELLPLALLSHGNETFAGFYCFLAGELASRGFVVAMLEHTDGSCTGLRSAKGVERVFGERRPEAVGKPSHVVRTEDVTAALDYLEAHRGSMLGGGGDDSAAPRGALDAIMARLDLSAGALLVGHSLGGMTMYTALPREPARLAAGLAMDPYCIPLRLDEPREHDFVPIVQGQTPFVGPPPQPVITLVAKASTVPFRPLIPAIFDICLQATECIHSHQRRVFPAAAALSSVEVPNRLRSHFLATDLGVRGDRLITATVGWGGGMGATDYCREVARRAVDLHRKALAQSP